MVRAPTQMPADGVVECTDSMEMPVAATVGAVITAVGAAYAMTHLESTVDNGGLLWAPLLGTTSVEMMISAGLGYAYAGDCRATKLRGAELAAHRHARVSARAEAAERWKRAATAARTDDCATVRTLGLEIRELDVEFHGVVFARDVAIARCVNGR